MEWISVKDKYPDKIGEKYEVKGYLICMGKNDFQQTATYRTSNIFRDVIIKSFQGIPMDGRVTHWRPLKTNE